jgi:hypothetical protein
VVGGSGGRRRGRSRARRAAARPLGEPDPTVQGGPAVSTTAPAASTSTARSRPLEPALSLSSVFGPDWSTDGALLGGFGGDLALVADSPTATGLPKG